MSSFCEQFFCSFEEFSKKFDEFKGETHSMFKIKSSETVSKANLKAKNQIPSHFVYSRVDYVCTHYGEPRIRGNNRVKSRTKHSATGCKASFVLKYNYYEKHLHIKKPHMEHNHPTTPETFAQEYQVKRLGQTERESLQDIVQLNPRNENLMQMVNTKFNKAYTLAEIRRMKHQLKSGRVRGDVDDLLDNLENLQSHGQVKVQISDNGNGRLFDVVAFSTAHMTSLFHKYPDVIYMDGTYKTNKCGYPLYQIMVEDGCGRGRAVFYAFVRQETSDILSKMIGIFCEFMGESVNRTKYAMTDKDPNEINAIKLYFPHASTMLCAFHVHKAMKARIQKLQCSKVVRERLQQLAYVLVITNDIATFRKHLGDIQSLSQVFYHYLSLNWLNCIETWAYHARLHSRLYFNDTNNKCEGENRRLKEILNSNTSMAMAVKKLFQHSLAQQLDVRATSAVETMSSFHFRDANPRWQSLYALFSAHAVQLMLLDHSSFPVPVTAVVDGFDCVDGSGVHYHVSGHPLSCSCPFFCQTSLPCCHMLSIFAESFDIVQADLYGPDNRWLKANVIEDVPLPQVAPITVHSLVGPEARHHRTEAVLARLSSLLKVSGSLEFRDRIEKIERVVQAWEDGRDCAVFDVELGQDLHFAEEDGVLVGDGAITDGVVIGDEAITDGVAVGDEAITDGVAEGDEAITDGVAVGDEAITDGVAEGDEAITDGVAVGDEAITDGVAVGDEAITDGVAVGDEAFTDGVAAVVGDGELSLQDIKNLDVKLPLARKRGRPKMLRTRSYKKSKRVSFNTALCYVCFQEQVSRGSAMNWVGCSRCPRWFHNVCLDVVPSAGSWVCPFCHDGDS